MGAQAEAQLQVEELSHPIQALLKAAKSFLKPDQYSIRLTDRLSYGRDCNSKAILWVRHGIVKYPPNLVVWPQNVDQVSKILVLANEYKVPVIPFGGGSGVCGGTWALKGGVAIDLKRLDRILQVDVIGMRVTVETGIIGEILERSLNYKRVTLGHFPSSIYSATLGGFLACRSAGQYSTKYGKIEDMVESLQVVLANGKVVEIDSVNVRSKILDLKEMFLGSEGTLGIVTQAILRVHPLPEMERFLGFRFPNLRRGLEAAREMMQEGLKPAMLRLYDPLDTLLVSSGNEEPGSESSPMLKNAGPTLKMAKNISLKWALKKPVFVRKMINLISSKCLMVLGFQGNRHLVPGEISFAEEICKKHRAKSLGEEPGLYWLKHRYSISYKLSPYFDEGYFADTLETATTWENLPRLYHAIRNAIGKHAMVFSHFSHAYPEGCSIYFTFISYRDTLEQSTALYDEIWNRALRACVVNRGTISHHHGVGVLKKKFMLQEWRESFEWLCRLKRKLDPNNIMNPGKLGFPEEW